MTLEERIEKERAENDRLALAVEDYKAASVTWFRDKDRYPYPGRGEELRRLKKESDLRLANLMGKRQKNGQSEPSGSPHPLDSRPDVVKRRAIVRQNAKLSTKEICKKLDLGEVVPPSGWEEKYNVADWGRAYRDDNCRHLVQKLVSQDKKKAGRP